MRFCRLYMMGYKNFMFMARHLIEVECLVATRFQRICDTPIFQLCNVNIDCVYSARA